jgi:hypothetical protein
MAQLNYRPSASAVHYKPPKRVVPWRTLIGCALAALAIIIGSIAYVKLVPHVENIYLRLGATGTAALITGAICMAAVRFGRVYIQLLAASIGTALGLLALYVMWLVFVHDFFVASGFKVRWLGLVAHPSTFIELTRLINQAGTWKLNDNMLRGPVLLFMWIAEGAAILAAAVLMALKGLASDDPMCSRCAAACTFTKGLPRFATDREDELLAVVENREFALLNSQPPPADEDAPEISLRLLSCRRCGEMNVLTVNRLSWSLQHGTLTLETTPLVNQLLITREEAEVLKNLKTTMPANEPQPEQLA